MAKTVNSKSKPSSSSKLGKYDSAAAESTKTSIKPAPRTSAPRVSTNALWRTLSSQIIQTKLHVGAPDDVHEKEANVVAGRVTRNSKAEGTRAEQKKRLLSPKIQRKATSNRPQVPVASFALGQVVDSPSQGHPLRSKIRRPIELELGVNLSAVRVHNDSLSQRAAADINALAFTHKNHIYLAKGQSPDDLSLMAHESTHVVQQNNSPNLGSSLPRLVQCIRDPVAIVELLENEEIVHLANAFYDDNLVSHQNALESLSMRSEPEAFELIVSRVEHKWTKRFALEAAHAFFIFHPEVATAVMNSLFPTENGSLVLEDTLLYIFSQRSNSFGPAAVRAYKMLDNFVDYFDINYGYFLSRRLQSRALQALIEQLRSLYVNAYWYDSFVVDLGAAHRLVQSLDTLRDSLSALSDHDLDRTYKSMVEISVIATRVYARIDSLRGELSTLIEQGIPLNSDEGRFLTEHLLAPYAAVLEVRLDALHMLILFNQAEQNYLDRAERYQDFKIEALCSIWEEVNQGNYSSALHNESGLRTKSQDVYRRFYRHKEDFQPRFDAFVARHEVGETLPAENIATIQRDLYILAIEGFACQHFVRGHVAWEHLESLEEDLWGDFDELQEEIFGHCNHIHSAVVAGDLARVIEITQDSNYRFLFEDLINRQIERKADQSAGIELGILAVSILAGGLVGLAVRGGGLLVFGARMGAGGTRALAISDFVGNVAGFTLAHESLSSAAFGRDMQWEQMPGQFIENAAIFLAFGLVHRFTSQIGRGAEGALRQALAFSVRHGVSATAFTLGSAGVRLIKTGQLPADWRNFLQHTLAAYLVMSVVGAGVQKIRTRIEPRLLSRALAARFHRVAELESQVLHETGLLEGNRQQSEHAHEQHQQLEGMAQRQLEAEQLHELRRLVQEYASETISVIEMLRELGHVPTEAAENIISSSRNLLMRVNELELVEQEATVYDLEQIEQITAMGDGMTYIMRSRFPSAPLSEVLTRYQEMGFEVTTGASTGEISVLSESVLVARFIPSLSGELLSASLAMRGVNSAGIRALSELPVEYHPDLRTLHPDVLYALARTVEFRSESLPQLLEILLATDAVTGFLRGPPQSAVQYVKLVGALEGILGAETHVHAAGAVPRSQQQLAARLVRRLRESRDESALYQRSNSLRDLLETLPDSSFTVPREALISSLEALKDGLQAQLETGTTEIGVQNQANAFRNELEQVLSIPRESAAEGPQIDAFFQLYPLYRQAVWQGSGTARRDTLGSIAESMREADVAYVELRVGSSPNLTSALQAAGAIDAAGRAVADARVILTITRNALAGENSARAAAEIGSLREAIREARNDPVLNRVIVGVDLSGMEIIGEGIARNFGEITRDVVTDNYASLEMQLTNPSLVGADGRLLGEVVTEHLRETGVITAEQDVVSRGREVRDSIQDDIPVTEQTAVAELSNLNRNIQDALLKIGTQHGEFLLPPDIMGITIHAGEQLTSNRTNLMRLLNQTADTLTLGTHRIGHGLILGIPFPGGLQRLGFTPYQTWFGRVWARRLGVGSEVESYTEADVSHMESLRLSILEEAAASGVTVEINPTSNITLSGLTGAHPVAEMLREQPRLRISVSRDNPAIHNISFTSELALLSLSLNASFPVTVRVLLEGYSSRLGRRTLRESPSAQAPRLEDIRINIIDSLVERTPASQREAVVSELNERYGLLSETEIESGAIYTETVYRNRLSVFVMHAVY